MDRYKVYGMSCAACSSHVEKAVSSLQGVDNCTVSLLTNSMQVEGSANPSLVEEAVQRAGYRAVRITDKEDSRPQLRRDDADDAQFKALRTRFIASLLVLLPLMYVSMGHSMWQWPLPQFFNGNGLAIGLVEFILTSAILLINRSFFVNGYKGIIRGATNMDTLVSMGSAGAYLYGVVLLFIMTKQSLSIGTLTFESAAMVLTLITLGKMLEAYSKGKTTVAIKDLMNLAPQFATVLIEGAEQIVPIDSVKVGDIFIVRSGESIPVDGLIIEGNCSVNEAALSGESLPVDKAEGDSVWAVTTSVTGFIKCRAQRVGADTTFSRIIQTVIDAAAAKAPIAKLADKVSGVFVPIVLGLSIITLTIWWLAIGDFSYSLERAISVLVISCPCALGLATPVAIMVGSGKGARNGILFRTASSLEVAGKITTVALDKTGTITMGKPKVVAVIPLNGCSEHRLLLIAHSLERKSEHPLGKAVVEHCALNGIEALDNTNFKIFPGNGLCAMVGNSLCFGGNRGLVERFCPLPVEIQQLARDIANRGETPMFFGSEGELVGIISVADTIKQDAPLAINRLKAMGISVVMLTGDNEPTARAIANQVGIERVIASVLPNEKAGVIAQLKEKKGKVAMVGDGINDAPALTAADLGIAIGGGTDIAIDSADVVLIKSSLMDVCAALALGRKVLLNIKENLFWAFIYNIIGIPLAAGVFIPLLGWSLSPMFGAAAMSLSSFCVVMNALRLNGVRLHFKIKNGKAIPTHTNKEDSIMIKTIRIEGMMCPHCEGRVKTALTNMEGVSVIEVSHAKGVAVVELNGVGNDALKAAVEAQGYKLLGIE